MEARTRRQLRELDERGDTASISSSVSRGDDVRSLCNSPDSIVEALLCGDAKKLCAQMRDGHNPNDTWTDGRGSTVLHLAASLDSPDCLIEILKGGKRPRFVENAEQETPLHVASRCAASIASVLLLVSIYDVPTNKNVHGDSFMHILLRNEKIVQSQLNQLVDWLLRLDDVRALLNHTNHKGYTAYDIAMRYHADDVFLLRSLLQNGASDGRSLRRHQLYALDHREGTEREALCDREAGKRRSIELSSFRHLTFLENCRMKLGRIQEKERSKRRVILERESHQYETLTAKQLRHNRIIRRCLRKRQQQLHLTNATVVQRVGRGFLTRKRFREHTEGRKTESADFTPKHYVDEPTSNAPLESSGSSETDVPLGRTSTEGSALCLHQDGYAQRAARIIWGAYRRYKERSRGALESTVEERAAALEEAVLCAQSHARGAITRKRFLQTKRSAQVIQRAWRYHQAGRRKAKQQAVRIITTQLKTFMISQRMQLFINEATALLIKERLHGITQAVTGLVWRENFCSAFRRITFLIKRRRTLPPARPTLVQRWLKLTARMEKYLLLAQFLNGLFLLIYMGCIPRTVETRVHNSVDIAFIALQLFITVLLPPRLWRVVDLAVGLTALVCAAASAYGGALVITLFCLKLPFVVRVFATRHSGTHTYCRAIEFSAMQLVLLFPLGAAAIGSTVRGMAVDELLLTAKGNWAQLFLYAWSTLAPQYEVEWISREGQPPPGFGQSPVAYVQPHMQRFEPVMGVQLTRVQMPLVQLIFFHLGMMLYTMTAVVVGTHDAIRTHYDISDETKLKKNKHRFRNEDKMDLFDAHRAANITALGEQLDGVMWEADIRAAKEAVDASHYDHNTSHSVQRFVCRVQDSVVSRNAVAELMPQQWSHKLVFEHPHGGVWDCRNEDPHSRATFDLEVIEAALGVAERKVFWERFFERQWVGGTFNRESTIIIVGMLVMASIKPNLFVMEAIFSAVLTVELLLSFYFLRWEFIFSHYLRLFIRLFGIVIGFVPPAIPFVSFRSLRLFEGWSDILGFPGMVRWGMLYALITFATLWMIAFVASLQFEAAFANPAIEHRYRDRSTCLALSLRDMVLPAWTPEHIDPVHEAPVMGMLIVIFQLLFIPFFLTIVLHPLLQLSNFIGRFLRLVVQSLHKDVLNYLESYIEGSSWYSHWTVKSELSANVITKLKMWVYDCRRNDIFQTSSSAESTSFPSAFLRQVTFVDPIERPVGVDDEVMPEIVCRKNFASFEENDRSDHPDRHETIVKVENLLRRPEFHLANAALTFTSVAFLWVADASVPSSNASAIVASAFHIVSIGSSAIMVPRDLTGVLTLVSGGSLLAAVVMFHIPGGAYKVYYCLRFISLLRLSQLEIFPFRKVRRFVRTYIDSLIKVAFATIVIGGMAYVAELLRAQIFLARKSSWGEVNATATNLTYPELLASHRRTSKSHPNTVDTRHLFAYYFRQDAYIYFSIFNFWILPALCISTCLAYLFLSGSNLIDTRTLTIDAILLMEDPLTVARFKVNQRYYRWVGNVFLIISLVFGCVFSPSTNATRDDLALFFGFELVFTAVGLLHALFSAAFAVHRCSHQWARRAALPKAGQTLLTPLGDVVFLIAEVVELLYYTFALPLCATLLKERQDCLISPNDYATFFITLRFTLLLRLASRSYLLSLIKDAYLLFFAGVAFIVYFVGSASVLADIAAAQTSERVTPRVWRSAFDELLRQTFTASIPEQFEGYWRPLNATANALEMLQEGSSVRYVDRSYTSDRVLFILAVFGKAFLWSAMGLGIALALAPLRSQFFAPLPPKSALLYKTLCGGIRSVVQYGVAHHDDMRPETRSKIQKRKFARLFNPNGIPAWLLPHLLEELNICRPARQRRFMFALENLLVYLPISERRREKIAEYMNMWDCYCSGGPAKLSFSSLPVFHSCEEVVKHTNPYASRVHVPLQTMRIIQPLQLIQAVASFELDFPASSSVGSKLWLDFFLVVQKLRGATLLQSLWRMYKVEKSFDADPSRTHREKATAAALRRSFRKSRIRNDVEFRIHSSFTEALRFDHEVFNPDTGHYDLLNRLRGHFSLLVPTKEFIIRARTAATAPPSSTPNALSLYMSKYMKNRAMRRNTLSAQHLKPVASFSNVATPTAASLSLSQQVEVSSAKNL